MAKSWILVGLMVALSAGTAAMAQVWLPSGNTTVYSPATPASSSPQGAYTAPPLNRAAPGFSSYAPLGAEPATGGPTYPVVSPPTTPTDASVFRTPARPAPQPQPRRQPVYQPPTPQGGFGVVAPAPSNLPRSQGVRGYAGNRPTQPTVTETPGSVYPLHPSAPSNGSSWPRRLPVVTESTPPRWSPAYYQRGPDPPSSGSQNTEPIITPPMTAPNEEIPMDSPTGPGNPGAEESALVPPTITPPSGAPHQGPTRVPSVNETPPIRRSLPHHQPTPGGLVAPQIAPVPHAAPAGRADYWSEDPSEWIDSDTNNIEYVTSSRNGFFFQWDHLFWSVTPPDSNVIGDPASEGVYVVDGISAHRVNSLDTSFIGFDIDGADRLEFGWNEDSHGWIITVLFGDSTQSLNTSGVTFIPQDTSTNIDERLLSGWSDSNNDGIDDDLDGDNIHGNDGLDRGTPDGVGGYIAPFDGIPDEPAAQDTDDLVIYLPVFETFSARYEVEMRGFEWMATKRYATSQDSHWEFLYGIRLLEIDDSFAITGTGGVLDETSILTAVRNQIIGGQIGCRWARRRGNYMLALEGRVMMGANLQEAQQQGSFATNFQGGANQPAALTSFGFNSTRRSEEFAPMGEWRIESAYAVNKYTRVKIGYTGMVIDGYSYAGPKVQYALPSFGMSTAASNETIFVTAFTLGLEINR